MRLSLLLGFGEEEKSDERDDGFWVLWEVSEGRRERVRENMVVF
jgi:hypothetical protein